ncbi:MAG: GNAT family N-acetyltransferase [Ruminiclostridium sp.]|nr:GNAT family N-acetyltransferase [Ruminiclostridium sp.]
MKAGEEKHVSDMVWEVFKEFVAPGYSTEGIETFKSFIQATELKRAAESGRFFTICCWDGEALAGSITMRDSNHISLLFVKKDYHRRGIAKELFSRGLQKCKEIKPDLYEISVNSSPYALEIYKKLGFSVIGEQTTRDGITYIPMNMKFDANILIHEMQIDNYSEIYRLWSTTPGMGLSDADTHENIHRFLFRNKGLSFICRHEGRIIGIILCGHDGRRGYIYHVTVAEKYRGRGIGQMLVDRSLQKLKVEGINKCHIFVFSDNEVGNVFWSSTGWTKREDILVYSKNIKEA